MQPVHVLPLYRDIQRNVEASPEEVAEAHRKDLEVQEEYGVNFTEYWVDEEEGTIFCLFEAPDAKTGERVHREATVSLRRRSTRFDRGRNETARHTVVFGPTGGSPSP